MTSCDVASGRSLSLQRAVLKKNLDPKTWQNELHIPFIRKQTPSISIHSSDNAFGSEAPRPSQNLSRASWMQDTLQDPVGQLKEKQWDLQNLEGLARSRRFLSERTRWGKRHVAKYVFEQGALTRRPPRLSPASLTRACSGVVGPSSKTTLDPTRTQTNTPPPRPPSSTPLLDPLHDPPPRPPSLTASSTATPRPPPRPPSRPPSSTPHSQTSLLDPPFSVWAWCGSLTAPSSEMGLRRYFSHPLEG